MRSEHTPRGHLNRSIRVISIIVSRQHRGHQHLQPLRRRRGSEYLFWSKLFIFVLGLLDFPTDQPRTAHVSFHVVHPLQRGRAATVVVALLLQLRTHCVFSCTPFPFSSVGQQPRVNSHVVDSPCSSMLCGIINFIWHWTCKVHFTDFDHTI